MHSLISYNDNLNLGNESVTSLGAENDEDGSILSGISS